MVKSFNVRLSSEAVDEIVRQHVAKLYGEHLRIITEVEYDYEPYDTDRAWFDGYNVVAYSE